MNTRTKTIFMAGALVAALSALNSQAADQSAFFATQMQISDGYYPQYTVQPTNARTKPESAHQIAEDTWLGRERAMGSGVAAPVPFPVPVSPVAVATRSQPASEIKTAENKWLTSERNETDGNVAPVPFAVTAFPATPAAYSALGQAEGR
jgi:hypothetical protein